MKRFILLISLVVCAGFHLCYAQESRSGVAPSVDSTEDEEIIVNYKGKKPLMTDFMEAILSQKGADPFYKETLNAWNGRKKGHKSKGRSFFVDEENGCLKYNSNPVVPDESIFLFELCRWKSSDGKRLLIVSNLDLLRCPSSVDTRNVGLSFYWYDIESKKMKRVQLSDLGDRPSIPSDATDIHYHLSCDGESIIDYEFNSCVIRSLFWDGERFEDE